MNHERNIKIFEKFFPLTGKHFATNSMWRHNK
jgi:hypothetical protein